MRAAAIMSAMATATTRAPRLRAVLREGERVTPLELFFDLVFVLAITQCTALMFHQPTWQGLAQVGLWVVALLVDMGGPFLLGAEGWRLVPGHFAERHGLIIIIALGESIVAIGGGAHAHLTLGIAAAAVLGIALSAALWWIYFDVVALVSARRLVRAAAGRVQNELARDSYSYLHFPMVAGIVLAALGLKTTLGDVSDPLATVPAFALLGGVAFYLLGLVG